MLDSAALIGGIVGDNHPQFGFERFYFLRQFHKSWK